MWEDLYREKAMTVRDDETDRQPTVLDGSGGASRTVLDQVPIETVRERSQESGPVRTILESPGTAGSGGGAWLPSALAERFRIVRTFPARGFEADVHVVVDGRRKEWVAKVYRNGITPKSDVLERIRGADRRHVVGLEEFGLSDGRWWELLEYIPHATLSELLGQDGRRGPALAKAILQQVAAALAHLHALDIVHRDLKPDNVLVRKKEPLDLVLTDFGIASIVEGASRFTRTARTLRYAPPEAQGTLTVDEHGRAQNVSEVDRSWDYWSLGMILVEVLTGCHPFDNLDDAAIGRRLATMDTDGLSEAVSDPVWRKLCRGLLRRDPDHRWGAAQVAQWLRDPSHPSLTVAAEGPPLGTQAPGFRFQGREYVTRQELAAAFSAHWEGAESIWKNRNQELRTWLEHDLGEVAVAAALKAIDLNDALNLDAQLFLAISALHPERVPRFRDRELSPEVLGQVVAKALAGDAEAGGWIERLHAAAIMRSIVSETAAAKRLRQIGEQWFQNVTEYQGLEVELRRRGAMVRSLDRAALVTFLACALPVRSVVEDLRRRADAAITADALQQDWFKRLGSGSNATAAALLVIPQVAGFAASDARARRYERNVSIYGSLARGLIGLNLGLVAGMFLAVIPGFIPYWIFRWIWDAETAFTLMLIFVGIVGVIGAKYPWREPRDLVGDESRNPRVPVQNGLILSAIGIAGLVFLGVWGIPHVFEEYKQIKEAPIQAEVRRVAALSADVWATAPNQTNRQSVFTQGSDVRMQSRWQGSYKSNERRFEIRFPDGSTQFCNHTACDVKAEQVGRYELRAVAGGRVLASYPFEVQARTEPRRANPTQGPQTANPRPQSTANRVQQPPQPRQSRDAGEAARTGANRVQQPAQSRSSADVDAAPSSAANRQQQLAAAIQKCFTVQDRSISRQASLPLLVTLNEKGLLPGPAILPDKVNRREIDTNLLRAAGMAVERCEPYGEALGKGQFRVTFHGTGRVEVTEVTSSQRTGR
jgi:serine/threonine protein kinase